MFSKVQQHKQQEDEADNILYIANLQTNTTRQKQLFSKPSVQLEPIPCTIGNLYRGHTLSGADRFRHPPESSTA